MGNAKKINVIEIQKEKELQQNEDQARNTNEPIKFMGNLYRKDFSFIERKVGQENRGLRSLSLQGKFI